jgi:hypothetical protein
MQTGAPLIRGLFNGEIFTTGVVSSNSVTRELVNSLAHALNT